MDILFLGTGSGCTSLTRHHSAFCFIENNDVTLIDAGDGISKALLLQSIDIDYISSILISHYHSDHFAGLPSLITQMIIKNRKLPLTIFTNSRLIEPLKIFLETSYIFIEELKFQISIVGFEFGEELKISENICCYPKQNSHIRNKHNIKSKNISFISSSFLFDIKNKKIVYTSDIGGYEDLFLFQEYNSSIYITEATHIKFQKIYDAITILNPKKTILTHIDNEEEIKTWFNQLSVHKKQNIIIAEDGMRFKI